MATMRFPDGERRDYDESAARHMQVGDVVAVPVHGLGDKYPAVRVGTVTRRGWDGGELTVFLTDPAPPTIDRPVT